MTRYTLAITVPVIGPWIIWPGAAFCELQWGKGEAVIFLLLSFFVVIVGIVVTNDRLPRHNFLLALIQFVAFFTSIFVLKYVSYLLA